MTAPRLKAATDFKIGLDAANANHFTGWISSWASCKSDKRCR